MRKFVYAAILFVFALISNQAQAQTVKTIKLDQTTGEFNIEALTLKAGEYVFEIAKYIKYN